MTDPKIEKWLELSEAHETARRAAGCAFQSIKNLELPDDLRAATPDDISPGKIVWIPGLDERKWRRIDQWSGPDHFIGDCGQTFPVESAFVDK